MAGGYESDTRPRKGDVTPDSQRAKYEARGGEVTSIGDEMDAQYDAGFAKGASAQRGTGSTRGLTVQRPTGFPSIAAPMTVELVLISADEFLNEHRPPLPSRLLVTFAVFGLLGLAPQQAAGAATAFAWGLVVATFYSSSKGSQPGGIKALTTLGNFLGGKYSPKTTATKAA